MSPIVVTLARHGIPGQMGNSYLGGPPFNAISPAQFYRGGDRGSPMVTRGMAMARAMEGMGITPVQIVQTTRNNANVSKASSPLNLHVSHRPSTKSRSVNLQRPATSYPSSTRQLLLSPRTPIIRRRRLHPVHMFLGVDEAGRSPVLGQALVYGIPYCPATYEEKLDELDFAGAMDFL